MRSLGLGAAICVLLLCLLVSTNTRPILAQRFVSSPGCNAYGGLCMMPNECVAGTTVPRLCPGSFKCCTSTPPSNTRTTPSRVPIPSPSQQSSASSSLTGAQFYVNPSSQALQNGNQRIGNHPTGIWVTTSDTSIVSQHAYRAAQQGTIPIFVAYNIPNRDCGGFSGGGSSDSLYLSWVRQFAGAIGSNKAIVILEPDALAQLTSNCAQYASSRVALLGEAVNILKSNTNTKVYIDAGHPGWPNANTAARLLKQANVARADGFSINVSNYVPTSSCLSFGNQISSLLGGKHFVIDTSRNGANFDPNGQWCNVAGAGLGTASTTRTGNPRCDAFLWIKAPGESDGNCGCGGNAGSWSNSCANSLIQHASRDSSAAELDEYEQSFTEQSSPQSLDHTPHVASDKAAVDVTVMVEI